MHEQQGSDAGMWHAMQHQEEQEQLLQCVSEREDQSESEARGQKLRGSLPDILPLKREHHTHAHITYTLGCSRVCVRVYTK